MLLLTDPFNVSVDDIFNHDCNIKRGRFITISTIIKTYLDENILNKYKPGGDFGTFKSRNVPRHDVKHH